MTDFTQANRLLAFTTPALSDDVLLIESVAASEQVSAPFAIELRLATQVHKAAQVSPAALIGKPGCVRVQFAHEQSPRYFHGIVNHFTEGDRDTRFQYFHAELVPWLSVLQLTADCRVFQGLSVPEIVKTVFADHRFNDYRFAFEEGDYTKWDYCVQYRETAFNFVSRLLEHEGIFYFFEHDAEKHTLVLGDATGHYTKSATPSARFVLEAGTGDSAELVTSWQSTRSLRPVKYLTRDFHFEMPVKTLQMTEPTRLPRAGYDTLEVFDYPGLYTQQFNKPGERLGDVEREGARVSRMRMEEEEVAHHISSGSSHCQGFASGHWFTLDGHWSASGPYVLTSVQHHAVQTPEYISNEPVASAYGNSFTCIPRQVTFRPPRITRKPVIQGTQTADVVGKGGEEIWTDKFGRVKVQFRWDRRGQRDEKSSCWIRVSHPWAGKGWGSISIPRVGQEVVVDFLEGDPDQPIIIGRVYNGELMPPYGLPAGAVISGVKSNSTKGGGGFNELSMDDTKGKEKITIHAQRDLGTLVEHDHAWTVRNDKTTVVDGTHTETVKGDMSVTVAEGNYRFDVATGTTTVHVAGTVDEAFDADQTTAISRDHIVTVGQDQDVSVTRGASLSARTITLTAVSSIELIVGGSSIKLEPTRITLAGGTGQVVLDPSGVKVDGLLVKLN